MSTAVPAGTSVASLTAAGTLQFADRYGYMQVTNTSAAVIYVSGDPNNTSPGTGNDGIPVAVGASVLVANQNPVWYQSSKVIPAGSIQVGDQAAYNASTNPTGPGNPGLVQAQRSLAGQMANPGTTVSASGACTVAAAG